MSDAQLKDEPGRIAALQRLDVLDTAPEESFDKIVDLVRAVLNVAIATVTLVDHDRQWFKAVRGVDATETPRDIAFCTFTIQQREPLVVSDATLDARFADNPLVLGDPFIRSYAGVPLRTPDGYNVGALCAIDTRPRTFSDAEMAILSNFALVVSDALELRIIAQRDHLTGALNRRGFAEEVGREFARHARYGHPASLIMLDIDHFKKVNDTFGHAAGDAVLRQMAGLCQTALRPSDSFGRLGGEEFALLLPEVGGGEALRAAERFRATIDAHRFRLPGGEELHVTASLGVAALGPADGTATINAIATADQWFDAADKWLYQAKHNGRNRCCPVAPEAQRRA